MPLKLLCEAITATTKISSALEIWLAPGKRASGVCAITRPMTVAIMIVQVVALIMPEVGSSVASAAATTVAPNAIASQRRTESAVTGPVVRTEATMVSALERARVQRLNAGASLATENSSATHLE